MPAKQTPGCRNEGREQEQKEQVVRRRVSENEERLGRRVLREKGKPERFAKIDVHYLYENNYRVNCWSLRDDPSGGQSKHIERSYYVSVDEADIDNDKVPLIIRDDFPRKGFAFLDEKK